VVSALSQHTQQQARRLRKQLEETLPLSERVIKQTRTRVLEGKKVPSKEKVLSKQNRTPARSLDTKVERWSSLGDK
jgi:hypothetical protein